MKKNTENIQEMDKKYLLLRAITVLQSELPVILKNKRGFNYKYADLSEIVSITRPLLTKNGLSVVQLFEPRLFGEKLRTVLITRLYHVRGEYIESVIPIDVQKDDKRNIMQSLGTSITYLRRYAYSAIIGLVSDEDTDGR